MSIKNLAEDDRPREKFLLKGKDALSDSELLAIILGIGFPGESALDLAKRILQSVDHSWHRLSLLSVKDLMKFKGIGKVKAIEISTALEIGRRRAAQEIPVAPQIRSSNDAYEIFKHHLADLRTEEFWAIFLSSDSRVLHKCRLSQGGITSSVVDLRVLFREAFDHYATSFIVAHNHPSGSLKPSSSDTGLTKRIADAGNMLEIILLDHLIISQNGYLSFKDDGLL